jgi:primosomal protein N'
LVTVPFGKRSIKGVVVDQQPARDLKSSLKSSSFSLRNVTTIHAERLPGALFAAGQKSASFFAQPVGAILETMVPQPLFDYYLSHPISESHIPSIRSEIRALQISALQRIDYYKTLIRENLAKNASTMIIVPSIVQVEALEQEIKNGIEDHVTVLHSKKTKKYIQKTIERLFTASTPIVHIATAPFAACVRPDWHTIIIEQATSAHYRYHFKPVFQTDFFIEQFARHMNATLVYADTLLDPTIRERIANQEIIDERSTWHIAKPALTACVDMKKSSTASPSPFAVLHTRTHKLITRALEERSQVLLITTRKGLAPMTVCSDCGSTVSCPRCQAPLVLHKARLYLCHQMHACD